MKTKPTPFRARLHSGVLGIVYLTLLPHRASAPTFSDANWISIPNSGILGPVRALAVSGSDVYAAYMSGAITTNGSRI